MFQENFGKLVQMKEITVRSVFVCVMNLNGEEQNQLYVEKMIKMFKMNVWEMFGRPMVDDFGGRYLEELLDSP